MNNKWIFARIFFYIVCNDDIVNVFGMSLRGLSLKFSKKRIQCRCDKKIKRHLHVILCTNAFTIRKDVTRKLIDFSNPIERIFHLSVLDAS